MRQYIRQWALWGSAVAMVACANTAASGSGGTTTATDTGSGFGGTDAGGSTGGSDTGSGGTKTDTAGGTTTDAGNTAGQTLSIADIQKQSVTTDCSKIVNTLNGVTVFGAVVASPVSIYKGVATTFVQTKGGGAGSGIILEAKSPGPVDSLKVGDVVDVVPGNVKEYYCMTELEPKSAESLMVNGTDLPVAVTIDVAKIGPKASDTDNRTYEAVWVSLENVTVSGIGDNGSDGNPHAIWVGSSDTDKQLLVGNGPGVYVIGSDKKTPNYKAGEKLNIQGFLQYSYKAWSLVPSSIGAVK